jgi:hypothetical protein
MNNSAIETATWLFRAFASGVASRDVKDRRMTKEDADRWVKHSTDEFRRNLDAAPASVEPVPLDAFKAIEAESNQLRELCTKHRLEASELRSALDDLLSWFPDKPSDPEWRLRGGQQGADDAVQHARSLINVTTDTQPAPPLTSPHHEGGQHVE